MNEFGVYNFSSFATCKFRDSVFPSHTPEFSYTFKPGAYALSGQIDNGGWAFTYALTPRSIDDVCIYNTPKFIYDGKYESIDYIRSLSYYLGNYTNEPTCPANFPAEQQFEPLLKSGKVEIPLEQVKERLGLTKERLSRPLNMTGNEVWRITATIGLAMSKKIFCFPWMTNNQLKPLLYSIKKLSEILKENQCILLLPVENKDLVHDFVNDSIDLSTPQIFR